MKPPSLRLFAAVLWLGCAAVAGAAEADILDGTEWKMREGSFKAKVVFWRYDHLTFKGGSFLSVDRRSHGFPAAAYTFSQSPDGIAWTSTLTSDKDGTQVWEGRRNGDRMSGTWTWVKPDGKRRVMPWTAKRVHP